MKYISKERFHWLLESTQTGVVSLSVRPESHHGILDLFSPSFSTIDGDTNAQRSEVTCPGSPREELALDPKCLNFPLL